MVLHEIEDKRFFDEKLLIFLKEKKNDDVRKIFQEYQPTEACLVISRLMDYCNSTLLHYAAEYGNEEIARHLIDLGSEIDVRNVSGRTPLMLAVYQDHKSVVELLLEAKPDVHFTNDEGKSVLQKILQFHPRSPGTSLELFFQHGLAKNTEKNIAPKAFIKKLRKSGITLHRFARIVNRRFIKLLLDLGYTANDSEDGKTALHSAVQYRNSEMVKLLVEYGADVNATDMFGSTPISYLNSCGNDKSEYMQILTILLNDTALSIPNSIDGSMQILCILIFGPKEAVELILSRTDNLNACDAIGNTVVHYMAQNGNADVIETLKGRNFDVDARNENDQTPLHCAAEQHRPHAVEFLLENRADVRARGPLAGTPLQTLFQAMENSFSLDYGNVKKCVGLLLEYGSDPFDDDLNSSFDSISRLYAIAVANEVTIKEPINILKVMEPILAHIAVTKAHEVEIREFSLSKIELQPLWVQYFGVCERQVDQMQLTTIYGNVKLLDFLSGSQKQILAYARNEELVSELQRIIEEFETNSPYNELLRKRVMKTIQLADLKKKAIVAVCRLINLKNNVHYLAAEYVIEYLNDRDMKTLICVM